MFTRRKENWRLNTLPPESHCVLVGNSLGQVDRWRSRLLRLQPLAHVPTAVVLLYADG